MNCQKIYDLGSKEIRKNQGHLKTCCNYKLVASLPAKKKNFLILAKNSWKIEIELLSYDTISHENQSLSQIFFERL